MIAALKFLGIVSVIVGLICCACYGLTALIAATL